MKKTIIYGPPGTGKTFTLMKILEDHLKYYDSTEIAYCSFTKQAVNEGKNRAKKKFHVKEKELPYFRTLHSLAYRQCNFDKRNIVGRKDYRLFSEALNMNFLGYYTEELYHNDDRYLFYDILERNNPKQASKFDKKAQEKHYENVSFNYRRFKKQLGIYDFTDMIEIYLRNGDPLPVKVAIIDEAQDLTSLQWRMVEKAFSNCDKIFIGGDDDQAIYEWSGADVGHFLALEGERVILDKSYRLKNDILRTAKKVVNQIETRINKDYTGSGPGGDIIHYTKVEDIDYNKNESWYLLARNNWFLNVYRNDLMKKRISFKDKNLNSVNNSELKKIELWENIRREKRQPNSKEKVMLRKELKNGWDIKTPWYCYFNWEVRKIFYYHELATKGVNIVAGNNLHVNTIHGVKGGEADNVVLILDVTKTVGKNLDHNLDSELRVLYTGITRAKKRLHIIKANTDQNFEGYM